MAMAKSAVILFTIVALFGAAMAAEHTVGDSSGWTTMGNIDYKKWAEGKQFHVGDTLVFKYNKNFHDVKQVSQQDFESCSSASPIASYDSGSDSITLKAAGHHYFLCGVQGHCQVGQKVDIMVSPGPGGALSGSPSGSPASAPSHHAETPMSTSNSSSSSSSSANAPTPSPSTSSAQSQSLCASNGWLVSAAVAFSLAGFGF